MADQKSQNAKRRFGLNRGQSCVCCLPRRDLLTGFAAVAASAVLPSVPAVAQAPAAKQAPAKVAANAGRIDVHRHFVPPGHLVDPKRSYLNERSTIPKQLEDMDKSGVALAVMSLSASALSHPDARDARKFSRTVNEYAAKLAGDHPGRFGQFAYLPFPDVEGSLKEIEYALDTLKADGIYLMTNYGDKFLGDPLFAPIFAELDRRRAVVYTHPTGHPCCERLVPGLRDADIEYGTNTTRAIAKYVFSGFSRRYPNVRMIWSHAGGTMPFLIRRFDKRVKESPEFQPILPEGFSPEARKFFYDIAQAPERAPMAALRAVAPVSQMLFGTDWPHLTTEEHVVGLQNCGVFDAAELKAIDRDNALRLMPTLRAV
ncbi:MAG: amidohydrolase [Xanthobacteraceae bacterium]|nr:amidohydrolase [Xanthobacteraceae bacterium]